MLAREDEAAFELIDLLLLNMGHLATGFFDILAGKSKVYERCVDMVWLWRFLVLFKLLFCPCLTAIDHDICGLDIIVNVSSVMNNS